MPSSPRASPAESEEVYELEPTSSSAQPHLPKPEDHLRAHADPNHTPGAPVPTEVNGQRGEISSQEAEGVSNPPIDLTDLAIGETGVVSDLPRGNRIAARFLALGFTLGVDVKMIQNFGHGPVIVLVRDTRVALGRSEAQRLRLIRKENRNV
jgi:ferrous iron transport protein A